MSAFRRHRNARRDAIRGLLGLLLVAVLVAGIVWWRGVPEPADPGVDTSMPMTFQPTVAFVGDSYTGGSTMGGVGADGFPQVVCRELDCHPILFAVGGSGWWRKSKERVTFGDMLDDICRALPQVVFVAGGANDADGPPAVVDSGMEQFFDKLEKCLPADTEFAITSPFWRDAPIPEVERLADELEAQAKERGWEYKYISTLFAGAEHSYIGEDLTHPDDAGHRYIAENLVPFLKPLIPAPMTLAEIREREESAARR